MLPLRVSVKLIRKLEDIITEKTYKFAESMANEIDPDTGKKSILVQVNGKRTYIPVGEEIKVHESVFNLLKDIGLVKVNNSYETIKPFDPIRWPELVGMV